MKNITSLYSALATSEIPLESRGKFVEFVLAKLVSERLAIPSSPVDAARMFYSGMHASVVLKIISDFNEQFPISVHETSELVYKLWFGRYGLCHEPRSFDWLFGKDLDGFSISPQYGEVYKTMLGKSVLGTVSARVSSFVSEYFT